MKPSFYSAVAFKTVVFFLIWLHLSESLNARNLAGGLIAALGVAWLNTERSSTRLTIHGWRLVRYLPWLVVRILHSGFQLSLLILHPDLPIDPKMIHHHTQLKDEYSIVLLGNSITLTPGTVAVEVVSQELVVHAIDESAGDDVTSRRMEQHIDGIFIAKGTG